MNWYRLIKLCQGVIEKPNYLEIGHGDRGNISLLDEPNYLWIYYDGSISVKPETEDESTHREAFPNISFGRLYYGRYEPSTGKLSFVRPKQGIMAYRDPPMSLINKLYDKFSNITEIITF